MDKNSIIGFVLLGMLVIAYTYFNAPTAEQMEQMKRKQDSLNLVQKNKQTKNNSNSFDSNKRQQDFNSQNDRTVQNKKARKQIAQTGKFFGGFKKGKEKIVSLQNSKIKLDFTTKGGRIKKAELNEFKTWDKKPLILLDGQDNKFNYQFSIGSYIVNTQDLYFNVSKSGKNYVQFIANADSQSYILQTYTLKENDFLIDYNVEFVGFDNIIPPNQNMISLQWQSELIQQEKVYANEAMMTSVFYENVENDVDYCDCNKSDNERIGESMNWISFKQQFFNQSLLPKQDFESAKIEIKQYEEDEEFTVANKYKGLKTAKADINISYSRSNTFAYPMAMYLGPNNYSRLKTFDSNFYKIIPLGNSIFGWMNRNFIIPIFNFLNKYIGNYGLIIIVLTLIIKLLLFPLTFKTYQSSAKMKLLKPDIEAINQKHEKDKQKAQLETMSLYRKAGVNPAGGCLPTLLQMPILFAMYRFFPSSIELRQQSFLWASDLSTYDSIFNLPFEIPLYGAHVSLFTLLMTVSNFFYMRMNQQMTPTTNEAMAAQMKMMQYFMPIMFLGIFNKLAAALTFYFFLSNVISYLQQYVIKNYFIDEGALKKQIAANKLKTPKKSKWQQRLENMQKTQMEMQKKRKK